MTREQLLPEEVRSTLPSLDAILDADIDGLTAHVKFFYPDFGWTWYGCAFDGDDLFYGFVDGFEQELGYFRLSELLENRGKWGFPIERDLHFRSTPVQALLGG